MKRKLLCVILFGFFPVSIIPQDSEYSQPASCRSELNMQGIIQCILDSSPEYRVELLKLKEMAGNKITAGYLFPSNPNFYGYLMHRSGDKSETFPPNYGPVPQATNHEIMLSQEIYTGGKRENLMAIANKEFQAQQSRVQVMRRNMVSRAMNAILRFSGFLREYKMTKSLYELTKEIHGLTRARSNQGVARPMDADVAKAEELKMFRTLKVAERKMNQAKGELTVLLGLPYKTEFNLQNSQMELKTIDPDIEKITELAQKLRPELKLTSQEIQLATRRVEKARLQRIPNITIGGMVQLDGFNEHTYAGTVSFPITLWRDAEGETKSALAQKEQSEEMARLQERNIKREIINAASNYITLESEMEQYDVNYLSEVDQDLENLKTALQTGSIRVMDALNSQRSLVSAKLTYIQAFTEFSLSKVELIRAIGLPFEEYLKESSL